MSQPGRLREIERSLTPGSTPTVQFLRMRALARRPGRAVQPPNPELSPEGPSAREREQEWGSERGAGLSCVLPGSTKGGGEAEPIWRSENCFPTPRRDWAGPLWGHRSGKDPPASPERRLKTLASLWSRNFPAQVAARLAALRFHLSPLGRRNAGATPGRFPREVPRPARYAPHQAQSKAPTPRGGSGWGTVRGNDSHWGAQDHGAAWAPPPEGCTAASSPKAGRARQTPPARRPARNSGSSTARPGAPASTFSTPPGSGSTRPRPRHSPAPAPGWAHRRLPAPRVVHPGETRHKGPSFGAGRMDGTWGAYGPG